MTKRLSAAAVAAIRKARESGMSVTAIAVEFDVDASTVSKRCAGIPQPAGIRPGRRRSVDYDRVARLHAAGVDLDALIERFGVSRFVVVSAIRSTGQSSYRLGRKLSPEVVEAIRSEWRGGGNTLAIANAYGVSDGTVRNYTRDMARAWGGRRPTRVGRPLSYRYPSYALEAAE